jgi:hypothetical protein
MAGMTAPLSIFRPGTHTAMSGVRLEFTEARLQAIAAGYSPAVHEAPLVVGHPRTDAPAYGWVQQLEFADGELRATPHQVDGAFAELVTSGRFKKISAAFYTPDAPGNPTPGEYYLRHVGFLGAQPPAVKGLRDASFSDAEGEVLVFADVAWTWRSAASLFRRMRELLIAKWGLEEADRALPAYEIETLDEAARPPVDPAALPAAYSEDSPLMNKDQAALDAAQKALDERAAALAAQEAQFAERDQAAKAAAAATAAQARTDAAAAFAEKLVTEGRVLPAERPGLVAVLSALQPEIQVEFAEGNKTVQQPAGDWLRGFLTALPKRVDFSERAGDGGGKGDTGAVDVEDPAALAAAAVEFVEAERVAGREISVADAVTRLVARQSA